MDMGVEPMRPGSGQESVWDYPRPPALQRSDEHVEVVLGGVVIADTRAALRILETSHPPTYYLPVADFRAGSLRPAQGSSFCEWKGAASYVDLLGGEAVAPRAGWFYPAPPPRTPGSATTWRSTPARSTAARSTARRSGPSPGTSTAAGSPTGSWARSRASRARASGRALPHTATP